jgi:DnaJ-domain-containing protein 1
MLDRIKDILKAELNDKLHQFTNYKSLEDLEIDEILNKLKNEHKQTKAKQQSATEEEYTYEHKYSSTNKNDQNSKEKEYYKALEIPEGSDFVLIKKSYRKLMKVYHPDLYHNDAEKFEMAKEVSQTLNEAYVYFKNKYGK